MSSQPSLQSFIENLHNMEHAFDVSCKALNFEDSKAFGQFNMLIAEGMEYSAANVVVQRLFIYHIERSLLDHVEKTKRTANASTYYNHINDYLDNRSGPYRDLVLFEIECLIKDSKFSVESIEKEVIIETTSIGLNILKTIMVNDWGINFDLRKIKQSDVEDYLMNYIGLDRKMALKFCLATMCRGFEQGDADVSAFIPEKYMACFDDFYNYVLDEHLANDQRLVLAFAMVVFMYMFRI